MSSATLLLLSLSQLLTNPNNETVYMFGKSEKNVEIEMVNKRTSFYLQSPDYPDTYAANKDYNIHFKLPQCNDTTTRYTLYLSCLDGFRMQSRPGRGGMFTNSECSDSLHINHLTVCGNDLSPENTQHIIYGPIKPNGVVFRFGSDGLNTPDDLGFKCRVIIDQKRSCSEHIQLGLPNSHTETISGVKLKRIEGAMINCAQTIEVPDGFSLKVTFLEFNLHPSDGEYCLSIGNCPNNNYCSDSKEAKNHWPPKELVVEPTNGVVIIHLMTYDIILSRSISNDKSAFVADVTLHRGQEQAGSAKQFIFADPTQNIHDSKSGEIRSNIAPKPPKPNRIYRQAMIPVESPGPDDTCMCWDIPAENLFMSLMAMGKHNQ